MSHAKKGSIQPPEIVPYRERLDVETVETFHKRLQACIGRLVKLTINDNRSTMLSVSWAYGQVRLSLHRMFLTASYEILLALARYVRREEKGVPLIIKVFIDANVSRLDYSHELSDQALVTCGVVYNLQEIYEQLNSQYFATPLSLKITWYGEGLPKNKSRVNLGLYYDAMKLIKIHRLLDDANVPYYVIQYVVYHEMLHAVCHTYIDQKGWLRAHGDNFTAREEQFGHYTLAKNWLKRYQRTFFLSNR
jgi:hypothetical protein